MLGSISRVSGNNKLKDGTKGCFLLLSIAKRHIKVQKAKEKKKN
jgi:hypothetical protein